MRTFSIIPDSLRSPILFWAATIYAGLSGFGVATFFFYPTPTYLWVTTTIAVLASIWTACRVWPHRHDKALTAQMRRLALIYLLIINAVTVYVILVEHIAGNQSAAWIITYFAIMTLALTAATVSSGIALVVAGVDFAILLLAAFMGPGPVNMIETGYVLFAALAALGFYWLLSLAVSVIVGRLEAKIEKDRATESKLWTEQVEVLKQELAQLRMENETLSLELNNYKGQFHISGVLIEARPDSSKGVVRCKILTSDGERIPTQIPLTAYEEQALGNGATVEVRKYSRKFNTGGMYYFLHEVA